MKKLTYYYQLEGALLAIEYPRGNKAKHSFIDKVLAAIKKDLGPMTVLHTLWLQEEGLWELMRPQAPVSELDMPNYPLGVTTLPQAKERLLQLIAQRLSWSGLSAR